MSKREGYTRNEIDRVVHFLKEQDKKVIDVSDEKNYVRQLAGKSVGDKNMYMLYADLARMNILCEMRGSNWEPGKGFRFIESFVLSDKFYIESIGRPIERDNQIGMFSRSLR